MAQDPSMPSPILDPRLNDVLIGHLTNFLGTKEIARFASTCKFFNSLHNDTLERIKVNKLLEFVAYGEQDKAEAWLQKFPQIILQKGRVTDYSDRRFSQISALQYAAWAYDIYMLRMLEKYLPEEVKLIAHQQLVELDTDGTDHGSHYDFAPLIAALESYRSASYELLWTVDHLRSHWIKEVGDAQKMLPVHVVNEYCHLSRPFYITRSEDHVPTFNENELKRSLIFEHKNEEVQWYPNSKLGVEYAITRLNLRAHGTHMAGAVSPSKDLKAIKHLQRVRKADYENFKNELEKYSQCEIKFK